MHVPNVGARNESRVNRCKTRLTRKRWTAPRRQHRFLAARLSVLEQRIAHCSRQRFHSPALRGRWATRKSNERRWAIALQNPEHRNHGRSPCGLTHSSHSASKSAGRSLAPSVASGLSADCGRAMTAQTRTRVSLCFIERRHATPVAALTRLTGLVPKPDAQKTTPPPNAFDRGAVQSSFHAVTEMLGASCMPHGSRFRI